MMVVFKGNNNQSILFFSFEDLLDFKCHFYVIFFLVLEDEIKTFYLHKNLIWDLVSQAEKDLFLHQVPATLIIIITL